MQQSGHLNLKSSGSSSHRNPIVGSLAKWCSRIQGWAKQLIEHRRLISLSPWIVLFYFALSQLFQLSMLWSMLPLPHSLGSDTRSQSRSKKIPLLFLNLWLALAVVVVVEGERVGIFLTCSTTGNMLSYGACAKMCIMT